MPCSNVKDRNLNLAQTNQKDHPPLTQTNLCKNTVQTVTKGDEMPLAFEQGNTFGPQTR